MTMPQAIRDALADAALSSRTNPGILHRTCQACGVHHPSLPLNDRNQCGECATEWSALAAKGLTDRQLVNAWRKGAKARHNARRHTMAALYATALAERRNAA